MPTYKVFLQRELVEEIEISIETTDEENITNYCPSSIVFEGVGAVKKPKHWKAIVHDIYLDPDRVEEVEELTVVPEFILDKQDGDWILLPIPKKPKVDPRQLLLLEATHG